MWLVTGSSLSWFTNKAEWINTTIIFEISANGKDIQIHFRHIGLVPEEEYYGSCTKGWNRYISGSLFKYINRKQRAAG